MCMCVCVCEFVLCVSVCVCVYTGMCVHSFRNVSLLNDC